METETGTTARGTTEAAPIPTSRVRGGVLFGVAIVLAGINLRPLVASVGPVLDEIRADVGLSAGAAAVLTALPVLCFGGGALLAPRLTRRHGAEAVVVAVLGLTATGLVVRLGPGPVPLFTGTFLAGAAVAVGNVVLPALIKRDFARVGLLMGAYVSSTVVGAAVPAAVSVPVARAAGDSWRAALGIWAVPAAATFLLWVVITRAWRRRTATAGASEVSASLLRDRLAWQVTLYMGLQSLPFYVVLSWLPTLYRSHGMAPEAAGAVTGYMSVLGIPIALVVPSLVTRSRVQGWWAVGATAALAAGYVGLLVAPLAQPYVWATLVGVGCGASFPLALTLVVLRSRDARVAAQLSAMSQSVGYGLAAVGPFVVGVLYDISSGWTVPLLFLLVLTVPQVLVGMGAGRAAYVGERAHLHRS